jgi:hypothetical protein
MRFFSSILLFLTYCFSLQAQNSLPSLEEMSFDLKYCGGAIYKHSKKIYIDPPPFSQEVELSISHRTYGKRKWERINNCPVPSINFCFTQYGDALGNAFSFYPGIEWSILRQKKIDWTFKVGGGIGIASNHWRRSDTLNNYLASKLNNFTSIQSAINFPITDQLDIQLGGRMSHMSNGAFRSPNFGINLFSGYVGANFYPKGKPERKLETATKPEKRKYYLGLRTGLGASEQKIPNGPMLPIYSQSVFVATPLLKKHRIFFGTDITHSTKALSAYKYTLSQQENLRWDATSMSVFVGAELLYGRVGLPMQFGIYTKKMPNYTAVWYQKLGFQYYFYKNDKSVLKRAFIGSLLKSNKINADYVEFCIGTMF